MTATTIKPTTVNPLEANVALCLPASKVANINKTALIIIDTVMNTYKTI